MDEFLIARDKIQDQIDAYGQHYEEPTIPRFSVKI